MSQFSACQTALELFDGVLHWLWCPEGMWRFRSCLIITVLLIQGSVGGGGYEQAPDVTAMSPLHKYNMLSLLVQMCTY